ncbi:hypothetical protein NM208_g10328 [Fusarium decemcellulare]|uniref:Uncharacterized protein n=1 Tax=Fusarium decemcellulare TaxID=57161 RepID=A0ACC1RYC6_9HYPO|nr:hypothetical protein NM208_g10328 [Fusarium decemcellulare]
MLDSSPAKPKEPTYEMHEQNLVELPGGYERVDDRAAAGHKPCRAPIAPLVQRRSMWLINTETLQLEEFITPPSNYAILSHTWEKDGVLFRDMGDVSHASSKAGWKKIELTCDEARRSSIPYAWVDTCCIDKRSSAELSEAINSMFMWYKQAWFTRGWALQELIAPDQVVFFDQDWNLVGTKSDWDFVRVIAEITGISVKVLVYEPCFHEASVAQKMSWAAKRQTTKVEDLAYCLLGIFNVNMPLLYGEGNKAFLRLQEEIAKEYYDLSLFAWKQDPEKQDQLRGLFATSPAEFAHCSELQERDWSLETDLAVTSKTLTIRGHLLRSEEAIHGLASRGDSVFHVGEDGSRHPPKSVGIYLGKSSQLNTYVRCRPQELAVLKFEDTKNIQISVRKTLSSEEARKLAYQRRFNKLLRDAGIQEE